MHPGETESPYPTVTKSSRKYPLVCFYLLAFGISWLGWAPLVAGSHGLEFFQQPAFQITLVLPAIGPARAAAFVTFRIDGSEAVRRLFSRFLLWRVGRRWYCAALLGPLAILLGGGGG